MIRKSSRLVEFGLAKRGVDFPGVMHVLSALLTPRARMIDGYWRGILRSPLCRHPSDESWLSV